jgi:Fe-S oxidoreductase
MLEHARTALVESGARGGVGPRLERWLLAKVVAPRKARAFFFSLLRAIQRLRLDVMAKGLLPRALRSAVEAAPRVPPGAERRPLPELTPAIGARRGRVIMLEGCVMRETFGAVNRATAAVLARNGYDVLSPEGQGCCGALQAHAGDLDTARTLARRNIEAWNLPDVDAVVVNSAGCGAALRGLEHWLPNDELTSLPPVKDVCEFLDEVGLREPLSALEGRVCYDDPCHLVHGQGVSAAPRRLLDAIPGLERVELPDATACCGAAGTYNITHRETSQRVLEPKLESIARCAPDIVATGNPGCMLQIASGLRGRGLDIEVVHPIELLERATRPPA